MLTRTFGDRAFLRRIFAFAIPIVIQNGITTFVSLLDNIMVGQVGTLQMSGVSIANQIILIFNLCILGANAGAGIFSAQFCGSKDMEGVRHAFRYKLLVCTLLALGFIALVIPFGHKLIGLYLQGEGDPFAARRILRYGYEYMLIMCWGFIPFAISGVYASTMRESGRTVVPMIAGIVAVLVNLCLNAVLIFGLFGLPALGAKGAALATVISRYVELGILVIWNHAHNDHYPYIQGVYRSLYVPLSLVKKITIKGMPLLVNECMWSTAMAVLAQSYSTCGLDVVPALNITETINNLVSVAIVALGHTVGILMGQMMGAEKSTEEILDCNRKIRNLSLVCGFVFGIFLACISPVFPLIYQVEPSVRVLATSLILVLACHKPLMAFIYFAYFSMRSGGKTWITFFFDCGVLWLLTIPVSILLTRFTGWPILAVYACCQGLDIIKCFIGYFLMKKGTWIQKLSK
jgi:putative MATE family efflux protein